MSGVTVHVRGLDELDRELTKLGVKMRRKIIGKAMRKGAAPIAKAVRRNAPRGKKYAGKKAKDVRGIVLRRSVQVRSAKKRRGEQEDVSVRVTANVPHAHIVEYGSGPRFHDDGKYVGQMPANPFMRRSFEATKGAAQAIIATTIAAEIEREVKG